MVRYVRSFSLARFTGWASLVPVVYFVTEWIVSASWRGLYGYRDDPVGLLGIAFCGPVGNWPCSELYRAMNLALVAVGLAVVAVAASFLAQRLTDRGSAVLLMVAGCGLASSGVITQNVSYIWNITATVVFMALGSVGALLVAVNSVVTMTTERRCVAVLAGLTGLIGFVIYVSGLDSAGSGGAQRLCIYGILVVVIAVGTTGLGKPPAADAHALRTTEEAR
jgi:hypothetical membrane protein